MQRRIVWMPPNLNSNKEKHFPDIFCIEIILLYEILKAIELDILQQISSLKMLTVNSFFDFELYSVLRLDYHFQNINRLKALWDGNLVMPQKLRDCAFHLQKGEFLSNTVPLARTERNVAVWIEFVGTFHNIKSFWNELFRVLPDFWIAPHEICSNYNVAVLWNYFSIDFNFV